MPSYDDPRSVCTNLRCYHHCHLLDDSLVYNQALEVVVAVEDGYDLDGVRGDNQGSNLDSSLDNNPSSMGSMNNPNSGMGYSKYSSSSRTTSSEDSPTKCSRMGLRVRSNQSSKAMSRYRMLRL